MTTQLPSTLKVGISDYKISNSPNQLITLGLGSCVGIALYEPETKTGGLLHIMLPDSKGFKDTSHWEKFADLAIPRVADQIKKQTQRNQLFAKIAGGASMFSFNTEENVIKIGERNVSAVKSLLDNLSIPLIGDHTGGKMGRTMVVHLESYEVVIRMVDREEFIL